jgi:tetratricopeptide (TPR) repeat protein
LLLAPFHLLHADDCRLGVWARQLPHLIARDLAAAGAEATYRSTFEGAGKDLKYKLSAYIDGGELTRLAKEAGASRAVAGGLAFQPEVRFELSLLDVATGTLTEPHVETCAPGLFLAQVPRVYRWIARAAGVRANGIPPFLGAGRSETALFALALDLDNQGLLDASDGTTPFDDPYTARFLPLLEALRLDPNFEEARSRLLDRCRSSEPEETDVAVSALQRAMEHAPRRHEIALELALLLDSRRRAAEAVPILSAALEEQPGHVDGRLHLGRLLLLTGHSRRALDHLSEAARLRPADWRPAFWLARLHEEAGGNEQARRWVERSLQLGIPDGPQRKRAESMIQRLR